MILLCYLALMALLNAYIVSSLCFDLKENFAGICTEISPTYFRLQASGDASCLTFKNFTFDDNIEGGVDVTSKNVCLLALYGNEAISYDKPYTVTDSCFIIRDDDIMMRHWFGRCTTGGCSKCTNHALLESGQDWRDFSIGDSCHEDDYDTDLCATQIDCSFEIAPTSVPSLTPSPSISVPPTPTPTRCGDFVQDMPPPVSMRRKNYTLFARLTSSECAESLLYGAIPLNDSECTSPFADETKGFLSTYDAEAYHDGFWQLVTENDGRSPRFNVLYSFTSHATLRSRFNGAARRGETVSFEIWNKDFSNLISSYDDSLWFGAKGAFDSGNRFTRDGSSNIQPGFSDDDFCWGAGPGIVDCASAAFRDGESLQDGTFFGQAVANADDGNCRFIFNGSSVVEGTSMRGAGAVTYLYFHRSYASPTVSPTTTFCDINGIIDGETAFVLSFTLLCFSGFILVAGVVLRLFYLDNDQHQHHSWHWTHASTPTPDIQSASSSSPSRRQQWVQDRLERDRQATPFHERDYAENRDSRNHSGCNVQIDTNGHTLKRSLDSPAQHLASNFIVFIGSLPGVCLFVGGAALTIYFNSRSSVGDSRDSNETDDNDSIQKNEKSQNHEINFMPGVRCSDQRWMWIGILSCCAAATCFGFAIIYLICLPSLLRRKLWKLKRTHFIFRRRSFFFSFHATAEYCVMCRSRPANTLNHPCGHMFFCDYCNAAFRREFGARCNVCRQASVITVVNKEEVLGIRGTALQWKRLNWFYRFFQTCRKQIGNNLFETSLYWSTSGEESFSNKKRRTEQNIDDGIVLSVDIESDTSFQKDSRTNTILMSLRAPHLPYHDDNDGELLYETADIQTGEVRVTADGSHAKEAERVLFSEQSHHSSTPVSINDIMVISKCIKRSRETFETAETALRSNLCMDPRCRVSPLNISDFSSSPVLNWRRLPRKSNAVNIGCGHMVRCLRCARSEQLSQVIKERYDLREDLKSLVAERNDLYKDIKKNSSISHAQLAPKAANGSISNVNEAETFRQKEMIRSKVAKRRRSKVRDQAWLQAASLAADEVQHDSPKLLDQPNEEQTFIEERKRVLSEARSTAIACPLCLEKSHVVESRSFATCPVCLDSFVPIEDLVCVGECGHLLCVECCVRYIRSALGSIVDKPLSEFGGLQCPLHSLLLVTHGTNEDGQNSKSIIGCDLPNVEEERGCDRILSEEALLFLVSRPARASLSASQAVAFDNLLLHTRNVGSTRTLGSTYLKFLEYIVGKLRRLFINLCWCSSIQREQDEYEPSLRREQDSSIELKNVSIVTDEGNSTEPSISSIKQSNESSKNNHEIPDSLDDNIDYRVCEENKIELKSWPIQFASDVPETISRSASQLLHNVKGIMNSNDSELGEDIYNNGSDYQTPENECGLPIKHSYMCPEGHRMSLFESPQSNVGNNLTLKCSSCLEEIAPRHTFRGCRTCGIKRCIGSGSKSDSCAELESFYFCPILPTQHVLQLFNFSSSDFHCSICFSLVQRDKPFRGCKLCNIRVCISCALNNAKEQQQQQASEVDSHNYKELPLRRRVQYLDNNFLAGIKFDEDEFRAEKEITDRSKERGLAKGDSEGNSTALVEEQLQRHERDEDAEKPLRSDELNRLQRFIYEASIPLENRFYCPNKERGCGILFDVPSRLLDPDQNRYLNRTELKIFCPSCRTPACVRCKILWHGALTCDEVDAINNDDLMGEDLDDLAENDLNLVEFPELLHKTPKRRKKRKKRKNLDTRLIEATSKACPYCSIRISHYHGHACHHIAPGTGCINCGYHFCFSCLAPAGPDADVPCDCKQFCDNNDIFENIGETPVLHDRRCGCVFCPDCRSVRHEIPATDAAATANVANTEDSPSMTVVHTPVPCPQCDGTCLVCKGIVPPGGLSVQ